MKGSGRLYTAGATAIIKNGSDELFYRQSEDTIRGEFTAMTDARRREPI